MATKLHTDFLGPYVVANGSINRPTGDTEVTAENIEVARHIRYTPDVRIRMKDGREETWTSCGAAASYRAAKATMSENEFRQFVLMATSLGIMDKGSVARARYPLAAALHPEGHVDWRSAAVSSHMDLNRRLQGLPSWNQRALEQDAEGVVSPPVAKLVCAVPGIKTIQATGGEELLDMMRASAAKKMVSGKGVAKKKQP